MCKVETITNFYTLVKQTGLRDRLGPGHHKWNEALNHGMNYISVLCTVSSRVTL